jgi:hypothetical protein
MEEDMRKLIARLEVHEDTEADSSETRPSESYLEGKPNPLEPWTIVLAPDQFVGHSKLDVLAHELGHFVSLLSETPIAVKDVDNTLGRQPSTHYQFAIDRYAEESEAWDIAKMIKPNIPDSTVDYSLGTYKTMINHAQVGGEV